MGNLFSSSKSKPKTFDSIVLNELNRPLVPDIQHRIFQRLNETDEIIQCLGDKNKEQDDQLQTNTVNLKQFKIQTNQDIQKFREQIKAISIDINTLVNNDKVLHKKIANMEKELTQLRRLKEKPSISGLYQDVEVSQNHQLSSK